MLGVIHHSPVVVSVIFDRNRFRKQFITFDEIKAGVWDTKVEEFLQARDSSRRQRVLFIDRLEGLSMMVEGGFDPEPFKLVVFDACDALIHNTAINIIDVQTDGETWKLYRLLPERFNDALMADDTGLVDGWDDVKPVVMDPSEDEVEDDDDLPPPSMKSTPSATSEMSEADRVMQSILDGADDGIGDGGESELEEATSTPAPPPEEPAPEPEVHLVQSTDDTDPTPAPKPGPKAKPKKKAKAKKAVKPKVEKAAKPKPKSEPKAEKPKPKGSAPKSHQLF